MFIQNKAQIKIDNLKSLAGSIAHETRNPLASIQQGCDIARTCLHEALELIELISTSSKRGLMISDMILANIRDDKIDKDKFVDLSIAEVVNLAIKEFAFESDRERNLVNVNLHEDFVFKGDETMAVFVIINLLKNSLYYKAKIDIWVEKSAKGNFLHFKDYGVGIAADKLEDIFDDFFTSDKKGGTGLGLPYCKRIMKAFGGDIVCESVQGEFTEFVLSF